MILQIFDHADNIIKACLDVHLFLEKINVLSLRYKVVNDEDGWKAEAGIHLNDGQNCGEHANCGRNQRLSFKKISGNDGIINFKVKANIPGAYNFTYETTHQGGAVVNKRQFNYLTNENLYPVNFEVYPQINSIHPNAGSLGGNTLVTISGSGFISDGLGGSVSVMVGDVDCTIEQMTETMIKCRTPAGTEEPPSFVEQRKALFVDTPEMSSAEYQRFHFSLDEVSTAARCLDICAEDYSCVAYIFQGIESDR